MTKTQQQALVILCVALTAGAIFQAVAKQQAAILGMSAFDIAILGVAAGSLASRVRQV